MGSLFFAPRRIDALSALCYTGGTVFVHMPERAGGASPVRARSFEEERTMEHRYTYRLETPADWAAAEALTREAFWNVYKPGCDEHYILHIMRGKPAVAQELNYVCTEGEAVRGHIFYTHTAVVTDQGDALPVLSFGPISVDPARQGQGIGSHLIRMTLRQAAEAGHAGVVITGNPAYYSRFGFRPASDFGIVDQDGASYPELMALELGPQRLAGIRGRHHFCPEFSDIDPVALERFDKAFPPKERLRLPGQLF